MSTIEDTRLQLINAQSWKNLAQVSEASTIPVLSFGELFQLAKLDVQLWEEYPVSIHQRFVIDIHRHVIIHE